MMRDKEQGRCVSKQEIVLYHYRELDAQRHRTMEDHFTACADCREARDKVAETLALLTPELMGWSPSDQRRFCARVTERIDRRSFPAQYWAGGLATAALTIALLLPWRFDLPNRLSPSAPPPATMAEIDMLEQLDFLQALDLLEVLDLLEELEPLG